MPVLDLHEQLARQRAAAPKVIAAVRELREKVWDRQLPENWYTVEAARELSRVATDDVATDPPLGVIEGQLAVAIATQLDPDEYPRPLVHQVRAEVWKNLATVHRYGGNFAAAHRALDAATRTIEDVASLGYDRAVLQLARAILIVSEAKREGVTELLDEALAVFREYADDQRIGQCLHVLGMFLYLGADYARAAATLKEAAALALRAGDLHGSASLASALGHTLVELGDVSGGAAAFAQARTLVAELDEPSLDLHLAWGLAKIRRANGEFEAATEAFTKAAAGFQDAQLFEDAGICWLDAAECALGMRSNALARQYLAHATAAFAKANLPDRLATALAYARDLAASEAPQVEAVRHVRRYLREQPEALFLQAPGPES